MEVKINKTKILILAGGKGTRMGSELPKVLMQINGKPMIKYVLDSVIKATGSKPIIIVGHKAELIKTVLGDTSNYVLQQEQLGTGHAVMCALDVILNSKTIVVLSGDHPFLSADTISNLINKHESNNSVITMATTEVDSFSDWKSGFMHHGRIMRNNGKITSVKEYKDLETETEKDIKEVNVGTYVFETLWLVEHLNKINNNNKQGEYYITDLLKFGFQEAIKIESLLIPNIEGLGANTKEELGVLEEISKSI